MITARMFERPKHSKNYATTGGEFVIGEGENRQYIVPFRPQNGVHDWGCAENLPEYDTIQEAIDGFNALPKEMKSFIYNLMTRLYDATDDAYRDEIAAATYNPQWED